MEEEKQIIEENEELMVNETIDALNEIAKVTIYTPSVKTELGVDDIIRHGFDIYDDEIINTPFVDSELKQPLFRDDEKVIFSSDTNYLHVDNSTPLVESVLTTTDSHEMVYKLPTGKNKTAPNKFGVKYKKERQRKNKQQKKSRKASRR